MKTILASLTALGILGLAAPSAQGAVQVDKLNGDDPVTPLVTFTSAQCRKATVKKPLLYFTATAKKNGYTLRVNSYKPLAAQRTVTYGSEGGVDINLYGPAGSYSSLNMPPDSPPAGGAIAFNQKRTKMGLGFTPMLDRDITSGVELAGSLTCKYPKPKKKKRRR